VTVQDDIAAGRLRWASEPRLHRHVNEDRVGMTQNAVFVLDGATTPATLSSCCDKDASWYVDRLSTAITARLENDQHGDLRRILAAAISHVQAEHATSCPDPTSGRGPSSTVAIARRRGRCLDLLVLGDSTILLDHGDRVTTVSDTRLTTIASHLRHEIKAALANGHGYGHHDHEHRRARLVEAERAHRNRDGGYWIAADKPQAANHALTATHPIGTEAPSVRRLVLMSDGVQRGASLVSLNDADEHLLAALAESGPEECIRRIRAAEAKDPDGRHYPRTKPSDDASLVVWDMASATLATPA